VVCVVDNSSGISVFDSVVTTAAQYGTVNYPQGPDGAFIRPYDKVNDARIMSGRWVDLKTEMNTDYESLKAAYGYLRAPWSLNPSPYITRFAFARVRK
jgi:hypothetical protein